MLAGLFRGMTNRVDQSWVVSVYSGEVKVCFWPAVRIYFWRGYVIIIVIITSFEATTPYLAICDFHFSIKLTINSIIVWYGIYSKVVGTTCVVLCQFIVQVEMLRVVITNINEIS